jgi:hypothetical protein
MEYANYAILVGQRYVTKGERHIAGHLTTLLHRSYRETNTTNLLICGAWEY